MCFIWFVFVLKSSIYSIKPSCSYCKTKHANEELELFADKKDWKYQKIKLNINST